MQANFQIVAQTYTLQRELNNEQHEEVKWWEQKLRQISAIDYCAQVLTTGPHSTLAVTGANRILEIFKLKEFAHQDKSKAGFKSKYAYQHTQTERNRIYKNYLSELNRNAKIMKYSPLDLPLCMLGLSRLFSKSFDIKYKPIIFRGNPNYKIFHPKSASK